MATWGLAFGLAVTLATIVPAGATADPDDVLLGLGQVGVTVGRVVTPASQTGDICYDPAEPLEFPHLGPCQIVLPILCQVEPRFCNPAPGKGVYIDGFDVTGAIIS
jgi:hypothetical protein